MTSNEHPIVFQSEGNQIIGVHHACPSDKMIIFCHGFTGNKCENKRLFVEAARDFQTQRYNVLRFDFFGSGDSDGEFKQSRLSHNIANLRDAIAWAVEAGMAHIAVLGISLGAATAILAVNDQPIEALVSWSAVPDMRKLLESHVGVDMNKPPRQAVFEYDGWQIEAEFGADALQYDVMSAIAELTLPKFIVQGTADAPVFVDGFHAFRDVVTPPADFMEIPEAGHTFQTPRHRHQVIRQTAIWLKRHF